MKSINKNFRNFFGGISQRSKIFLGVGSVMAVSALLWTNATPQSQLDERIQNTIPRLSERLQTQCHCNIEIKVGELSAKAARPALRSMKEAVRSVSRLCKKEYQKVCAGIRAIHFEEVQTSAQSPDTMGEGQPPVDPSMMPDIRMGLQRMSLDSGVLVVPIASADSRDLRASAREVARLLRISANPE